MFNPNQVRGKANRVAAPAATRAVVAAVPFPGTSPARPSAGESSARWHIACSQLDPRARRASRTVLDRFAPPILNRGQVAIMHIKQGGLREIVVGKESGYVKNRPALMGGCPPTGSQILSVSGFVLAFFKMEPRHHSQGGKRSITVRQHGPRLKKAILS
jgi:hypothetical protein